MPDNIAAACLPIREADLIKYTQEATAIIAKAKWKPRKRRLISSLPGAKQWSDAPEQDAEKEVSLFKLAQKISGDPFLMNETVLHVLQTVRQGLRIGMHLSDAFYRYGGMESLIALNQQNALAESQKTDFNQKKETASAIVMFAAASYIVWELSRYKTDEIAGINFQIDGVPEVELTAPQRAYVCMMFYYTAYVSDLVDSNKVQAELAMVKLTLLYFQAVLDEIKLRRDSLKQKEVFEGNHYKLEGSDFNIAGFDSQVISTGIRIEFNRMDLGSIVGNRDAKHFAHRLVERLLCYDFTAKQNPMLELGGFSTVRLGHGIPGTGKSMLIAAIATMLKDKCEILGYPFLFWPMPGNIISTFQGGSAERMMDWMNPMRDPTKIIYMPADDAENSFEDRTRQGVSAGVREVINIFLTSTEGATAINHGNAVIELYTNLPEQIDKAVLSRIKARIMIDGAKTEEEFLDQDHLWWRRYLKVDQNFVDMKDPAAYEYMKTQALGPTLASVCGSYREPTNQQVKEIFEKVLQMAETKEHRFFALLYLKVKEAFPLFSSRDVRNIQEAVSIRIMDFDLEPSWWENPEDFFRQDYDTKKNMLVELMKGNMKGLSFAEIRLEETLRYLDAMVRILAADEERRIEAIVAEYNRQKKAKERVVEQTSRV